MATLEPSLAMERVLVPGGALQQPRPCFSLLSPFLSLVSPGLLLSQQQLPPACEGSKSVCLGEEMKSGLPGRHHLASQPQPRLQLDLSVSLKSRVPQHFCLILRPESVWGENKGFQGTASALVLLRSHGGRGGWDFGVCVCVLKNHSKVAQGEPTPPFTPVSPLMFRGPLGQVSPGTPIPSPGSSLTPRAGRMFLHGGRLSNPNGERGKASPWLWELWHCSIPHLSRPRKELDRTCGEIRCLIKK